MKGLRWNALLLFLALMSCHSESSMKKIDRSIFLHDNSSKVWLVDKLLIHKNDYTPLRFRNKQLVVFHHNQTAYFYRMAELGDKKGLKSSFWLDQTANEFGFQFADDEWVFEVRQLSRSRIVLRPKRGDYPYTIVLIPFPEY